MLTTIRAIESNNRKLDAHGELGSFKNLDIEFDPHRGILWKFIKSESAPYFSHEVLDDIRSVQSKVRQRISIQEERDVKHPIKYVVFGSHIPGVFNLGGDLGLFRRLISNRDRAGLTAYSKKATDSVFYHASNYGDAFTFSLVQGTAMGGGFEAALAGNVLVAEKGSKLGFPEVLFGLFPGMGAYTFLRRRVDARLAEEIILGAKNHTAEALYDMGIVDVLCDVGDGVNAIESYTSRLASRSGVSAFRRALNHTRALDRKELYGIADAWVDAAMNLKAEHLRRIDRLLSNQTKKLLSD